MTEGSILFKILTSEDYYEHEFLRTVWSDTPFMADAYVGVGEKSFDSRLTDFLYTNLGPENDPDDPDTFGNWHVSSISVGGWRWVGFRTSQQLAIFKTKWRTKDERK